MIDETRAAQIFAGEPITRDESLALLASMAAQVRGTLADHKLLQAAIVCLSAEDAALPDVAP